MSSFAMNVFGWIGVTLIVFIIVADVILMRYKSPTEPTTWSELLRVGAWYTTAIPLVLGVWLGHWFPIVQEPLFHYSYVLVLVLGLAWIVLGDLLRHKVRRIVIPHIVTVVLGLVMGGLFWPMRHVV